MSTALLLPDAAPPTDRPAPRRLARAWRAAAWAAEWLFGGASLLLGLAALTAVPLGQLLALGYLLEVAGRVASSGRLGDGFVGFRRAAKLGGAAAGLAICWLPLWAVSTLAASARVVDPSGAVAGRWEAATTWLAIVFTLHAAGALLRGGRFRDFLRPLNVVWLLRRAGSADFLRAARDGLWRAAAGLRLPYYFWLGLRGYVGAFLWLAVPSALLGSAHRAPALGLLGGALLALLVPALPFLQARFARDGRFRALFERRPVRAAFRRAPAAFALAFVLHLLLAAPLYVLKIEAIPRDLFFLEGVVFLLFMAPARMFGGWALARGERDRPDRPRVVRWACLGLMVTSGAGYAVVVWGSQHVGWAGVPSLFEQHAFLLPVPFAGGEK